MAFETDEQVARTQEAIARAYDRFIEEHEDDVPFDPPAGDPDEPSDYAEHQPLFSATPEQLRAFDAMVTEEVARARVASNGS